MFVDGPQSPAMNQTIAVESSYRDVGITCIKSEKHKLKMDSGEIRPNAASIDGLHKPALIANFEKAVLVQT